MTVPALDPSGPADAVFDGERPRLLGLAYRMTGSMADAEDLVQDAWIRYRRAAPGTIERPAAWLTTVVSRLALDHLRSAHQTRETYVGPWLPEPIVTGGDPAEQVELRDSLTLGFLVLLERLGPVERVVFLLADIFAVPFDEIAATVERSPEACRQIASRARKRVRDDRPRFATTDAEAWEVTVAFFTAAQAGDIDSLLAVVADDVVLTSDGGADRRAARHPVVGADRVTRLFVNLAGRYPADVRIEPATINGEPGIVAAYDDEVAVVVLEVAGGKVRHVRIVLNPDKLGHLGGPTPLV